MTDKRIEQAIDNNLFGLQVTEGEMQQIITRAYAGERPRRRLSLVLVTALLIVALAATALAVIYASRVFVSEGSSDMVPHGDRLILYKWREGLFEVHPETGEETALTLRAPAAWHAIPDPRLLTEEGQLFVLSYEKKALIPFGIQDDIVSLGSPFPLPDLREDYQSTAVLSDGILAVLQKEQVQGSSKSRLVVIDRDSGEICPLADLDPGLRVSQLAFTPGSPLVFEANNALFTCDEKGYVQQVASLVRGDVYALYMLDEHLAAVASDSLILLRSIRPAGQQKRLTVLDPLGRGEDYKDFILQHPEIELSFPLFAGEDTEERFIQDMEAQSREVDIYLLRDRNLMAHIQEKGHALNLAGDPALSAFMKDLYPPFQAFFRQGEGQYGIPKTVFLPCLAYNQEAFGELGFKVPATWTDFFRFLQTWLSGLSDQHPDYTLMPFRYDNTLDLLLAKYLDERAANGLPPTVNTPVMQELLTLYKTARALDPQKKGQPSQTHLLHLVDVPYRGASFTALPLSFDPGSRPVLSLPRDSFSYFVVNPYSDNQEAALSFLRSYVDNLPSYVKILVSQAVDAPVENPEYEGQRQEYESRLAGYQEQLKMATGEEKSRLEEQVGNTRRLLSDLEFYNRWLISPRDIADYQQFSGMVYLSSKNPIPDLVREHPEMFADIDTNPDFDVEGFLTRLDEMIETVMREQTR